MGIQSKIVISPKRYNLYANGRVDHGLLGSYRIVLKQTWKMNGKAGFLI